MKILITGGSGFVGSNIAIYLKKRLANAKIYSLDNLSRKGSLINQRRLLNAKIKNFRLNIENFSKVISLPRFELIIDCCAEPAIEASDKNPDKVFNTNLVGTYNILKKCVDEYATYWGINVIYYEAFNFVKYEGAGQQFRIHADHGPAYNTTVSAVIYLNDNYEGGELFFPRLDNLIYKPKFGDIAIFPSNYIYEHASLDMISGTKYCVVVMTDINMLGHSHQGYLARGINKERGK